MNDFFINISRDSSYPSSKYNYNPDCHYPEYPWSNTDISKEKNHVYNMVRDCLIGLKLDIDNLNTEKWNPFGQFIKEGNTVVIKPNWVMHKNKNINVTENSLECLITHPSVVRAVADYCLIALKGSGNIIVGDAPMQGCNLEKLIEISGYNELFAFYNQHSVHVTPSDFRHYSTIVNKHKVLTGKKYNNSETFEVDLGEKSRFVSTVEKGKKYLVSDYSKKITNRYHQAGTHKYLIDKRVLSADVLINICKPKCHRLAGFTGALKNVVGITYDKACLPHRTSGSKTEGGDEYLNNSFLKRIISRILYLKIDFEERDLFGLAFMMRYLYGLLYYLMKNTSKDKFLIGSWYGNDTVWRMVLDLNHILLYADKNGNLNDKRQRTIFNLADMIISGEGNGPISPEPKKLGILLAGNDSVIMDSLICEIMGFDYQKVPIVFQSLADNELKPQNETKSIFYSNAAEFNGKRIEDLDFPLSWRFKPYQTWQGFIEKDI